MANSKGKMFCVTSLKGGVGKTVFTLNLAGIYSLLQKKVLVIDLDLYAGGIALYTNLKVTKTIYNFVDDLSNNRYSNLYDYVTKYNDYIDILACPKDPRQASKIDSRYIKMIYDNAIYKYDVVLVDMSHVLDKTNIMTLDYASTILYILTNNSIDLKNAKSFMAIMEDVSKDNIITILNASIDPDNNYFSNFDIKTVIKKNIDYIINDTLYIRNIDKYIMEGKIFILNSNLNIPKKTIFSFKDMAQKLLNGGDKNA